MHHQQSSPAFLANAKRPIDFLSCNRQSLPVCTETSAECISTQHQLDTFFALPIFANRPSTAKEQIASYNVLVLRRAPIIGVNGHNPIVMVTYEVWTDAYSFPGFKLPNSVLVNTTTSCFATSCTITGSDETCRRVVQPSPNRYLIYNACERSTSEFHSIKRFAHSKLHLRPPSSIFTRTSLQWHPQVGKRSWSLAAQGRRGYLLSRVRTLRSDHHNTTTEHY